MSRKISKLLGPEYDEKIRDALRRTLSTLRAERIEASWGVGGSQELETLVVSIEGRSVCIEAETYMGLMITGDEDLVERLADLVRAETR